MSEDPDEVQGFGEYHPEAAGYAPFNDAMAAWRNQVTAMQSGGALPPFEETVPEASETAPETSEWVSYPGPQRNAESPAEELTSQDSSDEAKVSDEELPGEIYDPAEHTAPDVLYYLKVCDYDEAVRILDSEERGKNRKGILNLKQDILNQAWKANTKAADSAP